MTDATLFQTPDEPIVTMRSPADLIDALPYLMGYHPSDSIVVVALHGPRRRLGGRLRVDLPPEPEDWPALAPQLAEQLVVGSHRRYGHPDAVLIYLCGAAGPDDAPESGLEERAHAAAEKPRGRQHREALGAPPGNVPARLRPLAALLTDTFERRHIPVAAALLVHAGRWWSTHCADQDCCPPEGARIERRGTPPIAAAAAYAGVTVRGSLRTLKREIAPIGSGAAEAQRQALDHEVGASIEAIVEAAGIETFRRESVRLLREALARLRPGAERDQLDDREIARLILGLQDRGTRDEAAQWVEPEERPAARRLWRILARRCVHPYGEHAAAPLTLLGWVSWVDGDDTAARICLNRALRVAPRYTFAKLLHQAVNSGLSPERFLHVLRAQRRHGETARRGGRREPEPQHTAAREPYHPPPAVEAGGGKGGTCGTEPVPAEHPGGAEGPDGMEGPASAVAPVRKPAPETGESTREEGDGSCSG